MTPPDGTDGTGIRVLIVEDRRETASIHRMFVDALGGFTVIDVVTTGRDALRSIAKELPDLVLLDLGLPDMSGLELLRRLRIDHPLGLEVIAVTADRNPESVTMARLHGARDYLAKPFTAELLASRLRAFERSRTRAGSGPVVHQKEIDDLMRPATAWTAAAGAATTRSPGPQRVAGRAAASPAPEVSDAASASAIETGRSLADALGVPQEVAERYIASLTHGHRQQDAIDAVAHPLESLHEAGLEIIRASAHRPDCDPATVAAAMAVSLRHLQRAFSTYDDHLGGAIRRRRVEIATGLLAHHPDPRLALEVVAERSGFGSPTSMRRAFIDRFGTTPRAWRRAERLMLAATTG